MIALVGVCLDGRADGQAAGYFLVNGPRVETLSKVVSGSGETSIEFEKVVVIISTSEDI